MGNDLKLVQDYIGTIEKELVAGNATEHTHRPALKALIEGLALGVTATNEPEGAKNPSKTYPPLKERSYHLSLLFR